MVRVRRVVVPVLLFLIALPVLAATAEKQTRPPRELHKVGDHWTPYFPPDPAAFPAGSKSYTIVKGDTLWALAKRFYNNAYLWPQLWEANTYITDAHWIYPGDPLLVQGEASGAAVSTSTGVSATPSGETGAAPDVTAQVAPSGPPVPLGDESDVYCFGYIGESSEALPNRIRSFEDWETKLTTGAMKQETGVANDEIVFIAGGTSTGLVAGDTYLVVTPTDMVYHPRTKEPIGRHYSYRGQVRILCATDTDATAIVTRSCSDIHIGDALKPMVDIPIPLARIAPMANVCTPPSGKSSGYIVNAKDVRYSLGIGTVVEINLGKDDFVQPGDFLTVLRDNIPHGNPPQVVGEIGILTAESHTATAMIVGMRYSMEVGDRVEVK
jgi:Uncharacterized protein containing LysM domain